MNKVISPVKKFSGVLDVPKDKSLTHRAAIFAALSKGVSTVKNPLEAEDCLSTLSCVEALGCSVKRVPNLWTIEGKGLWGLKEPKAPLNCGNSGTTMRLLSGVLSAQNFTTELFGDASLSKRPMDRVAKPLQQMGAVFQLRDGKYAPYKITGTKNLKPIHWVNPVASAQVKSAVLLAALHAEGETIYEEPTLSRDHTERMLSGLGVNIRREGTKVYLKGPVSLQSQAWEIPGDFSSAAFFIVGALLLESSNVTLKSVNLNPTRTGLLQVLLKMGAKIQVNQRESGGEPIGDLVINGKSNLKAGFVDEEISAHLIDEVPILAVAATQAVGVTKITGVEDLRVKETDRIKALAQNLLAMGANVKEEKDGLTIEGPTKLRGAHVHSFDDHRIAMSMAIAALVAEGQTTIEHSECVAISFPKFWDFLDELTWH